MVARMELRGEIARELNRESTKEVFKKLKIKSRKAREKAEVRYDRARAAALRVWKPDLEEEEIQEKASRVTVAAIGRSVRAKQASLFIQNKKGKWFRAKQIKAKTKSGKTFLKTVRTGKQIGASTVARSLSARAYWRRVRTTARIFGVSITEARNLDALLKEVPENVRRRIYERLVKEATRKRRRKTRAR